MLLMEAKAVTTPQTQTHLMKSSLSSKLKPALSFLTSSKLRPLCTHSITPNNNNNIVITPKKPVSQVRVKVSDAAQLKENWLNSLSCPSLHTNTHLSNWVIGIDPDLSGAFALLKTDDSGSSAQVFDSPYLPVLVGKRVRKRLDAKSIVQLVRSLDAPTGTTAYIEQSIPYPQDGKQGWWSGGFGYGLWIGILVASGFSVVPVPSLLWKNEFELSGVRSTKDESRRIASMLFPSLSSQLKRKKDHGRAEALLIAAYGKGLKIS